MALVGTCTMVWECVRNAPSAEIAMPCIEAPKYPPVKAIEFHTSITSKFYGDDYAVGHANFVIAYTKDNLAHVIYPGGVTRQDWATDLPQLVNETWSSR